jgi:hypothetical protein
MILTTAICGLGVVLIGAALNHQLLRIAHALETMATHKGDWRND